uniref:hypothetical protein n=1 Tax=Succinivibrio sp. TaxID=2053619 RepID=UPI003FF087E4
MNTKSSASYDALLRILLIPQTVTETDKALLSIFDLKKIELEKPVTVTTTPVKLEEYKEAQLVKVIIQDKNDEKKKIEVVISKKQADLIFSKKIIKLEDLDLLQDGLTLIFNQEYGSIELKLKNEINKK